MIYILTDGVKDLSWWGLWTRRYLRALYVAGVDYRVIWRKQGLHVEDVEDEFHFLFEGKPGDEYQYDAVEWDLTAAGRMIERAPRTLREKLRRSASALGVDLERKKIVRKRARSHVSYFGGSSEPGECTIYIGEIAGACESIREPLNQGPRNIAIVPCPEKTVPLHLVKGLRRYDLVLSPGAGASVLIAAGINAQEIPQAVPHPERVSEHGDPTVWYAIGSWGPPDMVGEAFAEFCDMYPSLPTDREHVLHLVCPDVPFTTRKEAAAMLPLDVEHMPRVSLDADGLRRSGEAWAAVHRLGDVYLSASVRADIDPWRADAAAHGNLLDRDAFVHPGNEYRDVGLFLSDAIRDVVRSAPSASVQSEAHEAPRVAGIAFVIPHKDRGLPWIEPTVGALASQTGENDRVIISDQGSQGCIRDRVADFCAEEGYSLISSTPPVESGWSISRARNAGTKAARELGVEAVMFLDCDIILPAGYVNRLREVLATEESFAAIPKVYQGGKFVLVGQEITGGSTAERMGSGLVAARVADVCTVGGYDETYQGHGEEDIEFLERFDALLSPVKVYMPTVYHQPHPKGKSDDEWARINRSTQRGGLVNPDGWGDFTWIVKEGKEQ